MVLLILIKNFCVGVYKKATAHPMATLVFILGISLLLWFHACQRNRDYKRKESNNQTILLNETKRISQNQKALQDTIAFLRKDSMYTKQVLAVKQKEVMLLDAELKKAAQSVKVITKDKIKTIYVTTLQSNLSSSDVLTKYSITDNQVAVGIRQENPLFNIATQTWFEIQPDSTQKLLKLHFLDKYGKGKPSNMEFHLNFKLQMVQTEMKDGTKHIYMKPTDLNGNAINPALLGIKDVNGVDYVDIPAVVPPKLKAKKPLLAIALGPQGGVTVINGKITPYIGFGIGLGLNVFR